AIFDAPVGGSIVAGPLTNAPTAVSNGLFTVTLNFGVGVFTGADRWLDIGVRSNGSTVAHTSLLPRQLLTPIPYAIFASGVRAAGIAGTSSSNNIGAGSVTSVML